MAYFPMKLRPGRGREKRYRLRARLSASFVAVFVYSIPTFGFAHDARDAFTRGTWQSGLAGGYARGFAAFDSGGSESEDVRMGALFASAGASLTDSIAPGRWFGGGVSLLGEGQFLWNREPRDGFGGSGALVVRYHFLASARHGVVPFLDGGAGVGAIDFDLESQHDGFNFILEGGVGVHLFLTPVLALTPSWRYHHISNAGTARPNVGINSQLFLLGINLFFP